MSPHRRPLKRSDLIRVAIAAGIVVGVSVSLFALRHAAPTTRLDFVVPGTSETDPDPVTCQRILPDEARVTGPSGVPAELPPPVGRVLSTEVVSCPDNFDGHVVEYIGEVVGDILHREGGTWVLMNDDHYALELGPLELHRAYNGPNTGLSVWLPDPLGRHVDEVGRPGQRGDVLHVSGILRRADPMDGGGLAIRAFRAELLADGDAAPPPVNSQQLAVSVVVAIGAAALSVVARMAALRR